MSLFSTLLSDSNPSSFIKDKIKLERDVNRYINHVNISEWSYRFNRIFVSPENSFNVKYFIKFLSSKSAKPNGTSGTRVSLAGSNSDYQLISRDERSGESRSSDVFSGSDVVKNNNLDEEDYAIDQILDALSAKEFFGLLDIKVEKRLETLKCQYRMFNSTLDDISSNKLDKLLNCENILIDVPYEVYTETAAESVSSNIKNAHAHIVNTVDTCNLLGLLKTCGIIVIDISRDTMALSKGKEIFRSFKKEIIKAIKKKKTPLSMKKKRLIVVISTVMTWAGADSKYAMNENQNERIKNQECVDYHEFELEVLAVNQTKELKEIVTTIIVKTGVTYGHEQDLFRFAFDSACKNSGVFPIPNSKNHVPVIHVENLARLVHKIISDNLEWSKYNNCIFGTDSPTNTLQQIISTLGKTCDVQTPTSVSLNTFLKKYKLEGMHKRIMSADVKINSSIDRIWPDFEWYDDGKPSIINQMKSLVEVYKMEHHIKYIKLHIIGPPASGKTELARRIAQHYKLTHLDPKQITQNRIDEIRKELGSLRQTNLYTDSKVDLLDSESNDEIETKEKIDPLKTAKILELEQYLAKLYSSMDANYGVLEDVHLIPLLIEQISFSSKRGYVLNGYPTTVEQAKRIFGDTSSPQQINVDKLPDMVVNLKKKIQSTQSRLRSNDSSDVLETKSEKKRIGFLEVDTVFSSNSEIDLTRNLTVEFAKPILKQFINRTNRINGKANQLLLWNEQNQNNLLKMFNRYYVPIKTTDSSFSSFDLVNAQAKSSKIKEAFEQIFNTVIKEIEFNQLRANMTCLDEVKLTDEEIDAERQKNELKNKMSLLEEFERLPDLKHIENMCSEKYLIKYVTPTLTKLIVQVAKVRPKNYIDFLAYMAVNENSEGLPDCPDYSNEGLKVKKLLKNMFHLFEHNNSNDTQSSMEMSVVHSTDDENEENDKYESSSEDFVLEQHDNL